MKDLRYCPHCIAYMPEVTDFGILQRDGWRKCPTCSFMHDRNGLNEQNKKLVELFNQQCFKLCSSESVDCTCQRCPEGCRCEACTKQFSAAMSKMDEDGFGLD